MKILTPLLHQGELEKLPLFKLLQVKQSLQKYFYKAGINIAFYVAYNDKKTEAFKNKLGKAIKKQILAIANLDKINGLLGKVEKATSDNLVVGISLLWLSLEEIIDGELGTIQSYLVWAGQKGGEAGLDKMIPPPHNFELKNLELLEKLNDRASFLVKTVDSTNVKMVAGMLQKAIDNNLSRAEIVNILRSKADEIAQERADLITETELVYAMNMVEVETFRRNGIEKHSWATSEDEKVCEICLANETAGLIRVGDEFPMGTDSPPAHPLCRCLLIPELPTMIEQAVWRGQ